MRQMERLFISSRSVQKSLFYSKLAVLEVCGWIEISVDEIVVRTARRLLRDQNYLALVQNEVKRVHGFEYEVHIRRLLIAVVGVTGVKKIERSANPLLFPPMCAALSTLKRVRDRHAHGYVKGTTLTIDAFSVTHSRFSVVHDGLRDIDRIMRAL